MEEKNLEKQKTYYSLNYLTFKITEYSEEEAKNLGYNILALWDNKKELIRYIIKDCKWQLDLANEKIETHKPVLEFYESELNNYE